MKISCEIIRDLLPLYHDDVCSEESRRLVEEHLKDCVACSEKLYHIGKEMKFTDLKRDETSPLRAIAEVWKKDKMKSFFKGLLIALTASALILCAFAGLTQLKIIPVSSDLLEISDVCRLSDGRIVYHLYVADQRSLHFIKFSANRDGSYYHTPYRSVIEGKRMTKTGLYNDYFVTDLSESNAYETENGSGTEITSFYVGPKGSGILIWEKGMDLPPASEELEKAFVGY